MKNRKWREGDVAMNRGGSLWLVYWMSPNSDWGYIKKPGIIRWVLLTEFENLGPL